MLVIDGILLLFVIIFLLIISGIWPPDSPWSPWWQTPEDITRRICTLAKVGKKTKIYDLGCGTGHAVIIAAKEFGATCVGIEIDTFRYLIAKFLVQHAGVSKKVSLVRGNFFTTDMSDADVLFIYLVPNALKRLAKKLTKELKPGTILVSYTYPIPLDIYKGKLEIVKEDKKNKLFMYTIV